MVQRHGRRPVWQTEVDGRSVCLTGAGGVFVGFDDPVSTQHDWNVRREQVAYLCNLVLCELTLVGVPCAPFTSADLCHAKTEEGGDVAIWVAPGVFSPASFAIDQGLRRGEVAGFGANTLRVSPEKVRELGDLSNARHLRDIVSTLPTFLAHAVAARAHGRAADCVIYAWTVCEILLNWLWDTHVLSEASSNTHRDRLNNPADFTASVRSEVLWRLGVLDLDELSMLNSARRARNRVAHSGALTREMAEQAIIALNAMLHKEYETLEERTQRTSAAREAQ